MPKIRREYTVDLNAPVAERWAKVIKAEKRNTKQVIGNAMQKMQEDMGPVVPWLAKILVPFIYDIRGAAFGEEIDFWSEGTGVAREELVLANLSYELAQFARKIDAEMPSWLKDLKEKWFGCTALAFNRKGRGGVAHVRNMDWPVEDCGKLSAVIHYTGGCGPFTSVGWPCFVGVISGIAKGRFSITLNQAPQVGMVSTNWPAAFALRNVFQECETFDQVVKTLTSTRLSASALFMVVGTKRDQAVVIEHTGRKAERRWMKDGVLALANHFERPALKKHNPEIEEAAEDEVDPQEDSVARAAYALRSAGKEANLPVGKMLSLLNRWPVLFEQTAQRMAFVPKTGEYNAHYWK